MLIGGSFWVGSVETSFQVGLGFKALVRVLLLAWWCWWPRWWWEGLSRGLFDEPGAVHFLFTHGWANASSSLPFGETIWVTVSGPGIVW